MEPQPSMMAVTWKYEENMSKINIYRYVTRKIFVTVAVALLEPLSDSCWPSSALTAVVMREKGPLIRIPDTCHVTAHVARSTCSFVYHRPPNNMTRKMLSEKQELLTRSPASVISRGQPSLQHHHHQHYLVTLTLTNLIM